MIEESARYYLGLFPHIGQSAEYRSMGHKFYQTYPTIKQEGNEPWVIYDFILGTGKKDLNEFSKTKIIQLLTAVKELMREDSINMQVERLEVKVVKPFKSYGTVVKLKREDLKATLSARNREAKQMQQLDRMRQRNPSDRQIIAESELQRATMNATRTTRPLEEAIDEFEKQKIRDIKKIFGEFVTVEMTFHAKALEVYTTVFQNILNVDEEEDLEVFRSTLRPTDYQSRLQIVCVNSKSPLDRTSSTKNM
ncbi:protein FAM92A [Huso huso]|uniref:Protein FAM92A n=1 Tax=Huso huso TaxID=61971 RepID=A0ABR1A2Z8_HUSHU